jgi:histidine ammonia-lyase
MDQLFFYGSDKLTVKTAILLAQGRLKGGINEAVRQKIQASQAHVKNMVDANKTVYGVTTGFGILANTKINDEDTATLQYKILQSHSVGVGDPVPADIARLMMITKVQALARGFSGVQLETIQRILWHLDNNVIPVVPEKGSVGASGDLAPLAHLFLPLIGLGEVFYEGNRYETGEVLKKFDMAPIRLGPRKVLH